MQVVGIKTVGVLVGDEQGGTTVGRIIVEESERLAGVEVEVSKHIAEEHVFGLGTVEYYVKTGLVTYVTQHEPTLVGGRGDYDFEGDGPCDACRLILGTEITVVFPGTQSNEIIDFALAAHYNFLGVDVFRQSVIRDYTPLKVIGRIVGDAERRL